MPVMKYLLAFGLILAFNEVSVEAAVDVILPDLDPDAIQCEPDFVNITISDSYLTSLNVGQIEKLILITNDSYPFNATNACTAEKTPYGYTFYLSDTFAECAIFKKVVNYCAFVYYKVRIVIRLPIGSTVIRIRVYEFSLHCKYNIKLKGMVGPLIPWVKKEKLLVLPRKRDFWASIKLFNNSCYNTTMAYNGIAKVRVPDPLYVGIWLHVKKESRLVLQARKCWVTPTHDPNDKRRFYIIANNGCPVADNVLNGNNCVKQNFRDIHVYFSFNAFYWRCPGISQSHLYLHCCLTVCDPLIQQDCTVKPSCSSKKRRSIEMEKPEEMKPNGMTTVSYGPIEVMKDSLEIDGNGEPEINTEDIPFDTMEESIEESVFPENYIARQDPTCNKDALGCAYDCAFANYGKEICVCPTGFGLKEDGKLCFQHQRVISEAEHHRKTQYVIPTVSMLALMTFCITVLLKKLSEDNNQ